MRRFFSFPNPVNETSARLVAAGAVLQCAVFLVIREGWVLVPLVYGFVARVLAGPTMSPLGQFATRVVTPRIPVQHTFVPGPPKRFAQGIGATFTLGAGIAWLLGAPAVAYVLVAGILVAATLESVLGICLGCIVFGRLMRWGMIPADVCAECNDISARLGLAR
ncbi:MAG: DUF4395 domain-containing protein [Acidimicrobiia bacterium]